MPAKNGNKLLESLDISILLNIYYQKLLCFYNLIISITLFVLLLILKFIRAHD